MASELNVNTPITGNGNYWLNWPGGEGEIVITGSGFDSGDVTFGRLDPESYNAFGTPDYDGTYEPLSAEVTNVSARGGFLFKTARGILGVVVANVAGAAADIIIEINQV